MKRVLLLWLILAVFTIPGTVSASPFTSIVTFGDSLSDNGSADGYGLDTSSNGPVWVEYLAGADHLRCQLYDYAYGGAKTGSGSNNLNWQIDTFLNNGFSGSPGIQDNVLFTIWAGGNDFLGLSQEDDANQAVTDAVFNVGWAATKLAEAGAHNILILNLPNLGATPLNNQNPYASAAGEAITQGFNAALTYGMVGLESTYTEVNFYTLDIYGILEGILDDPDKYGFDNTTGMLSAAGNTTDTYLFYDPIHPTTQAHSLIADYVASEVAPVPEPSTMLLVGIGLIGFVGLKNRVRLLIS